MFMNQLVRRAIAAGQRYHSTVDLHVFRNFLTKSELESLDDWKLHPPSRVVYDSLSSDHLRSLYSTLPTRDGSRPRRFKKPADGDVVPYGHHLAFFPTRLAEQHLRDDGTEADLSPPAPFTTRMWVGGSIEWDYNRPLVAGVKTKAISDIVRVEAKGHEKGQPMLFVTHGIKYLSGKKLQPSVTEERTHVYLHSRNSQDKRIVNRPVNDLPGRVDFSLDYTPTPITLFRYSALTFNAHSIHLDKEYCRQEGFPERLVHGPLTAQMLLETAYYRWPRRFLSFTYRARNPVVVNRRQTIKATWEDGKNMIYVWCQDDDGIVGMTSRVEIQEAALPAMNADNRATGLYPII